MSRKATQLKLGEEDHLNVLVDQAISMIQEYEPPEGWFVGDSGGKDSTVLLSLVRESKTKYQSFYSKTGIDPPEVVKFIQKYHPETKCIRPLFTRKRAYPEWKGTRSFFGMLQVKGFPCRTTRWCCDTLKKLPAYRVGLQSRLLGMRAEESRVRAGRPMIEKYKNQMVYKPLFHWKTWHIWEYIESQNLPYCELYDQGFERIGCVVCPFLCHGIKGNLKLHMDRWPKFYAAFEKAMRKLFWNYECVVNPRSGAWNYRRETDYDEFLQHWYEGV